MSEESAATDVSNLRIARLEDDVKYLKDQRDSMIADINDLKLSVARLSERLTLFQIFQATLSSILSGIAAISSRIP